MCCESPLLVHHAPPADQQSSSKNTIRTTLAEIMAIQPATSKPIINLGLGDPTTLHTPPPASITAVVETLQAGRDNGYIPGPGTVAARHAIGRYHKRWDGVEYGVNDITLVSACGNVKNDAHDRLTESVMPSTPSSTSSSHLTPWTRLTADLDAMS